MLELHKLTKFKFNNKIQKISFIETLSIAIGVECDVFIFENDSSKDLGIIRIEANSKTPLQKVLKGDKTIEGYISGKGILSVTKSNNIVKKYIVDNTKSKDFFINIEIGEKMQWKSAKDSPLVVFEICYPPYKDGRFKNI